ncbi:MAG: carboxypeptidase-like regulatory domain-containing protein, partial [Candidatus Marinimicrobia bacterium]|nr:carboxypeptidase-like regulatory domain-containing protein [Candidatus Neomarinimicrobiota bacterium]
MIKETILGAILLVGITGLAAYPADKETALFSGRIVDENAQPLWNANIVLKGTAIGGVSNKDGYFSISAAPDSYTVIISYMGYETIKEQIRLVPDTTLY